MCAYITLPACILSKKRNRTEALSWNQSRLIILLCIDSFMITILMAFHLIFISTSSSYEESGWIFPSTTFILIAFSFILGYYYLSSGIKKKKDFESPTTHEVKRKQSFLSQPVLEKYETQLKELFREKQLYLRYDMSIDLLVNESNIPRHHLSELFNNHLQMPFYRFIAKHRISYAIEKLKQNDYDITLEGLAYESGFNSKTTFNKYFKEIVGCGLSEYRQKQKEKVSS